MRYLEVAKKIAVKVNFDRLLLPPSKSVQLGNPSTGVGCIPVNEQ